MTKTTKLTSIVFSLGLMIVTLFMMISLSFAWFSGQSYIGKTLSYNKQILIGSNSALITNYHGVMNEKDELIYTEIDARTGFEEKNLAPSSYIYLKTEIQNQSEDTSSNITLSLQNIEYSATLNEFLYFGTMDPNYTKNIYKDKAKYNQSKDTFQLESILLIKDMIVPPGQSVTLYWFINIDSGAGNEVAKSNINLGQMVVSFI